MNSFQDSGGVSVRPTQNATRDAMKIAIALAAMLVSCSKQPVGDTPHTPTTHPKEFSPTLRAEWPPSEYSKVIGYRYEIPSLTYSAKLLYSEDGGEKGFRLHHTELAQLTRASLELAPDQVERLLRATFSAHGDTGFGGCYRPHHIFVFYGPDDVAAQAIEVCFECRDIVVAPEPPSGKPSASLKELATLCNDLGLWFTEETLSDYIQRL